MKKTLHVSDKLSLPTDTVTSTIIAYGGKGMGKTVLGAVVAEELHACGLRWAWLDPLGVGYGIRHSADGKGPGVECLVLGGVHGDIPIDPGSGAAVADVVVDESCNVLIDFSRKPSGEMWGVGEKIRFVTAYARRLFQRQGSLVGGHRREPLFQILDEGARYIPQNVPAGNPGLAECVSAWQQFVEEGRNIGLGLMVLTQRSARINKDVAELVDAMFAFRTTGPNSLDAVIDWLGTHVESKRAKALAEEVRKLPQGSALVVSPGWLNTEKVVAIRMRHTFDSSSTPRPGERPKSARGPGAKPNLERIRERMAENVEKAKADDPKALRLRISELEKLLSKKLPISPVEVPVPVDWKWLNREVDAAIEGLAKRITNALVDSEVLNTNRKGAKASTQFDSDAIPKATPRAAARRPPGRVTSTPRVQADSARDPSIGNSGLGRLMIALAQRPAGLSRRSLGLRAGLSAKSGTFATYLGRARSAGWVDGKSELRITDSGISALGHYDPLPTGSELFDYWVAEVGSDSGAARMLRTLFDAYPEALSRSDLAEGAAISPASGTFATYLGRLRGLELIEGKSEIRLSGELVDQ